MLGNPCTQVRQICQSISLISHTLASLQVPDACTEKDQGVTTPATLMDDATID